eukprot:1767138-Amphidinium_carterae.3
MSIPDNHRCKLQRCIGAFQLAMPLPGRCVATPETIQCALTQLLHGRCCFTLSHATSTYG